MPVIGVLALQGDFLEHIQILKEILNVQVIQVKSPKDLDSVDALIIPGGESTTIGSLMRLKGLDEAVREFSNQGKPLMGVCAGAILLAKKVADRVVGETGQFVLGLMSIKVLRNAFGRQRDSFEAMVEVDGMGRVRALFIRGPAILECWDSARILGYVTHPEAGYVGAAASERNLIALAFHPEISGDPKPYEYLVSQTKI